MLKALNLCMQVSKLKCIVLLNKKKNLFILACTIPRQNIDIETIEPTSQGNIIFCKYCSTHYYSNQYNSNM